MIFFYFRRRQRTTRKRNEAAAAWLLAWCAGWCFSLGPGTAHRYTITGGNIVKGRYVDSHRFRSAFILIRRRRQRRRFVALLAGRAL